MHTKPLNVLFLCTHNSARSILAEALLNHIGKGRFKAYSAGSSPRENQQPNPIGIEVLKEAGIATEGLHSKSWDDFARPMGSAAHEVASVGAATPLVMNLVITVCDNAAGEVCPYWPGQPATAHWGYADPSASHGDDPSASDGDDAHMREAFRDTLHALRSRLELFVSFIPAHVDRSALQTIARDLAKL